MLDKSDWNCLSDVNSMRWRSRMMNFTLFAIDFKGFWRWFFTSKSWKFSLYISKHSRKIFRCKELMMFSESDCTSKKSEFIGMIG